MSTTGVYSPPEMGTAIVARHSRAAKEQENARSRAVERCSKFFEVVADEIPQVNYGYGDPAPHVREGDMAPERPGRGNPLSDETLWTVEEVLGAIGDSALDAVVVVNGAGEVVRWNSVAEEMFGFSAEEIMGQKVHDVLMPTRYRERAARGMERFKKSGQGPAIGNVLELTALRKDGTEFPIELAVSSVQMEGQWWASATIKDITERVQAEEAVRCAHEELERRVEERTAELAKANEELRYERQVLRRLVKSHDEERQLIAYEIHDSLAQRLTAATMQFDAFEEQNSHSSRTALKSHAVGVEMVRDCLVEAHRLMMRVRPPILDEMGVVVAIRNFVCECMNGSGPNIEFQTTVDFDRLDPVLENALYRIVQEGVANACLHSKSENVLVELTLQRDFVRVKIRDWGIGFDPNEIEGETFGLESIRERARLLGGSAEIASTPAEGTCVAARLPLSIED